MSDEHAGLSARERRDRESDPHWRIARLEEAVERAEDERDDYERLLDELVAAVEARDAAVLAAETATNRRLVGALLAAGSAAPPRRMPDEARP